MENVLKLVIQKISTKILCKKVWLRFQKHNQTLLDDLVFLKTLVLFVQSLFAYDFYLLEYKIHVLVINPNIGVLNQFAFCFFVSFNSLILIYT